LSAAQLFSRLNPEDLTSRKVVQQTAQALTDAFHTTSTQLSNLNSDLTDNIKVKASEMNTITAQIADLNGQIQRIEGLGNNANDLRDQRDVLTDNLSKIVNVKVQDTPQGYSISMGNTNLVTGGTPVSVSQSTLETAFQSGDLKSGEVYGMVVSRDQYVADYQKQTDQMANTIANGDITVTLPAGSVLPEGTVLNGVTYSGANRTLASDLSVTVKGLNGLHKLGYEQNDPATGASDLFTTSDGSSTITAANMVLNPAIVADASKIASSMRTTGSGASETVVKGNNTTALLISQLTDTSFKFVQGQSSNTTQQGTIDDFYRSMIGQLGVQGQEATRQETNQKTLLDQVDAQRQSVSGVSLDEEMANLIKFQKAYAAAARLMTTFDTNLDKIINGMGLVGR
ncbi:MAG: flagellar hook-associated protein FlgK, partial [Paenibacillus sp. RIFOXYA1_FULL_44_5]